MSLGATTTLSLNPNISATTGIFSRSGSPVLRVTNTANSTEGDLGTTANGSPAGVAGFGGNSGYGVYGNGLYGLYRTSGSTAVYGSGSGSNSVGVHGSGVCSTGVHGSSSDGTHGVGVEGYIAGSGSSAIAVWGDNEGTAGYAGYFHGDLFVTGAMYADTKYFVIDHPLEAADKYLYHASVESSEMMNIYTGNVTLGATGEATVELPDWLEAENADFRYQLTAIGAPASGLYIAEEIANHQFKIAGGRPGMKVSWQVTGVRQDAYAKAHPLQVEVDKPENERGYYIHPELFGAPPEKSIEWATHPDAMREMRKMRQKEKETEAGRAPKAPPEPPKS